MDIDAFNKLADEYERSQRPKLANITIGEPVAQLNGSTSITWNILRDVFCDEATFKRELSTAYKETVAKVALVILNERRAEIEATLNFADLRDALAAELARQFMASRLMGQPTPFDPRVTSPSSVSSGGAMLQNAQPAIAKALGNLGMQSYAKNTSKP